MTRKAGARILLALLIIGAFAALLGLGTWQLQRLEWKRGLIAAAQNRPNAEAVAPPGPAAWPTFDLDDWNYRRIRLTGTYGDGEADDWIVLTEPKGELGGEGYFVVAPFTTEDGWSVLVNRGFVPRDYKDSATRPASAATPPGTVTVEGIVRRDDPPSSFTPAPDTEKNIWFTRDIATMGPFLGLDPATLAPYSVDLVASETPPDGLPQAGESRVTFANDHLQYALTWYGIAAALLGILIVAFFHHRQRGPDAESRPPPPAA